jgi:exonuclease III
MRLLTWNVRGSNAPDKDCLIKHHFDQTKPDIVCLQETKVKKEMVKEMVARYLGVRVRWSKCFVDAVGALGAWGLYGILSLWRQSCWTKVGNG